METHLPASPSLCPACRTAPVRTDWQLCGPCGDLLSDDEAQDLREAARREYEVRCDFDRAAEEAEFERAERLLGDPLAAARLVAKALS